MAMASTGGAPTGKRSLDAEINLVPFIDLLSMCICFLLITAVWIQIAVVQVKQGKGTEVDATSAAFDLNLRFKSESAVEVELSKNGRVAKRALYEGTNAADAVAKMKAGLDSWARATLGKGLPATELLNKAIGSAMVAPKQGVNYGDLVLAMDALRHHHLVNIGVLPTEGR